jgi:hypothetical protein
MDELPTSTHNERKIKESRLWRNVTATGRVILIFSLGCATLLSQTTRPSAISAASTEFPVILRQRVEAGKTPVGTKVQAKLSLATMTDAGVIPLDATFSGEVIESVAKTATTPSRLAIRMDSAQWKNGSAPVKVFLTTWFYPLTAITPRDLSNGPEDASHSNRTWTGPGNYPLPGSPAPPPRFPPSDKGRDDGTVPPAPSSNISQHRVLMKNVESKRNSDGSVALTSTHSNIKLDKTTTYVLAAGDLLPTN